MIWAARISYQPCARQQCYQVAPLQLTLTKKRRLSMYHLLDSWYTYMTRVRLDVGMSRLICLSRMDDHAT